VSAKSILVVEDDPNMREEVSETLEDEGYEVAAASCVDEALVLARRHQFDLLVTDVRMPGSDGVDGFKALKQLQPELRCIIISGYSDKDASSRAISIEVNEWIAKPFKGADLIKAADRVLNSGNWAAHYLEMVQKAPVTLISTAVSLFKRDKNAKLNKARDRAFLALHTAIRSNYVDARTANAFFSRLLEYDRGYREFLATNDEDLKNQLISSYISDFQMLAAMANSQATSLGSGDIPPTEFRFFYNAVQQKKVTVDDFKLSTILKDIDINELGQSPDLYDLRQMMWGKAA